MNQDLPTFVVVGNVNQGKSSIVATLIENGAVPIDSYPGTTRTSGQYAFQVGGRDLFRITDTPGFQEAREALAWMQERSSSAADRAQTVRAFVEAHDGTDEFVDEVRLLRPIVEGASILYVVDASSRFQPSNEAEMEILRWTGQPGMALINRTRERDHTADWRPILEQFFNLVREFNAFEAGFEDRLDLLRGFKEIRDEWRATMQKAVNALEQEWTDRRRRSAVTIAELLTNAMSHVEKQTVVGDVAPPGLEDELTRDFEDSQRRFERETRAEIERIYNHENVEHNDSAIALHDSDLFSEMSWRLFGLDRTQLAKYGAAWGAVIGGSIDLMVGGMSFFTGLAAGAGIGAITGYFGGTQVAKTMSHQSKLAKILFSGETGHFFFKGPVTNPRFAWMLLDRALLHFQAIRDRSHARQDKIEFEASEGKSAKQGIASALPPALRDDVDKGLRKLHESARARSVAPDLEHRITESIDAVLRHISG